MVVYSHQFISLYNSFFLQIPVPLLQVIWINALNTPWSVIKYFFFFTNVITTAKPQDVFKTTAFHKELAVFEKSPKNFLRQCFPNLLGSLHPSHSRCNTWNLEVREDAEKCATRWHHLLTPGFGSTCKQQQEGQGTRAFSKAHKNCIQQFSQCPSECLTIALDIMKHTLGTSAFLDQWW